MKDPIITDYESRHPSKKDAENFIKKLKNIDLQKIELSDLDEIIDSVFHFIPFGSAYIHEGKKIYRARKSNNSEVFNNISELGMRKALEIAEYGRANQPLEAIFYGATNMHLACGEVLQNLKHNINPQWEPGFTTVSVWNVIKKLHISPIYYSEAVTKVREDIAKYKIGSKNFTRENSNVNHETLDVSDMIMEFFCDEFSKVINTHLDYKYSVSYTRRLKHMNDLIAPKYQSEKFDGMLYPSVAMKYKGDNIALFDDDLASKIQFETAFQVVSTNFDFENGNFRTSIMHEIESVDEKGNIKWSKEVWQPR